MRGTDELEGHSGRYWIGNSSWTIYHFQGGIMNGVWLAKLSRMKRVLENLHLIIVSQEFLGIENYQIHPFIKFIH
jgi:hypothetical protein